MSGGHFGYATFYIQDIIDGVRQAISENEYSEETIDEFKNCLFYLRMADVYAHRVDWLLSGDNGEDTFHEHLQEDLVNKINLSESDRGWCRGPDRLL